MTKIVKEKNEFTFASDTLSFEELQELDRIEKEMLSGEFYTFEEVFHDEI